MTSDEGVVGAAPAVPAVGAARAPLRKPRGYVRFTARLARAICSRVAAGETLRAICAEAGMPSEYTVTAWARERAAFREIYHRAKAFARRDDGLGSNTTFCEELAHEICVRVAEGETLTSVCADPAMPVMSTVIRWQQKNPAFLEGMTVARQAAAERMADEGMRMALAAKPEEARLLREQLAQLRWSAAIKSPRTHGRTKPNELPREPPPDTWMLTKHFRIEEHPETGLVRMVTYLPNPDTRQVERVAEGPWGKKPGGLSKAPDLAELPPPKAPPVVNKPHDPEGWL